MLVLTSCGINVKTPREMDVKLKLDAKDVLSQVRNYSNMKVPPQYLKFLKEPGLKTMVLNYARKLNGECMVPSRSAVKGEQQGDNYLFSVHQVCYVVDSDKGKTYKSEFDIVGYVNTNSFKYELLQDEQPEVMITEVDPQEYLSVKAAGSLLAP
ncbi:MAG: hypothetical protein JST80_10825 [Bdellovibrionales bacterium]|nr:hypothetical protein [Bdellovibrionales bacterium]